MPERRRRGRFLGVLAAGLLVGALAGPAAVAQTDTVPDQVDPGQPPSDGERWEASAFDDPFDEDGAEVRRASFTIAGTLRYERRGPADYIREAEVRVVDDPDDEFVPADGCAVPEPVTFPGRYTSGTGFTAELAFLVEDVAVGCNGRYLVQAEGRLGDPGEPSHTVGRSFVVAVPPASIIDLDVAFDAEGRAVTVTFQPLATEDLAIDATGYVLERSGPDGSFTDVATIGTDDDPTMVDPLADAPAGRYTYRVRALRAGAEGDVRSSVIGTVSETVEVTGEPAPPTDGSTTVVKARPGVVRGGGRPPSVPGRRSGPGLTTSTTLDTGFEDSLDYGADRPPTELAGDDPVAGQSIVQDEGDREDMGLAIPAAGALVMLGWAGHIAYLNRLAKQL